MKKNDSTFDNRNRNLQKWGLRDIPTRTTLICVWLTGACYMDLNFLLYTNHLGRERKVVENQASWIKTSKQNKKEEQLELAVNYNKISTGLRTEFSRTSLEEINISIPNYYFEVKAAFPLLNLRKEILLSYVRQTWHPYRLTIQRDNETSSISVECKPPTCREYGLYKIWRDVGRLFYFDLDVTFTLVCDLDLINDL